MHLASVFILRYSQWHRLPFFMQLHVSFISLKKLNFFNSFSLKFSWTFSIAYWFSTSGLWARSSSQGHVIWPMGFLMGQKLAVGNNDNINCHSPVANFPDLRCAVWTKWHGLEIVPACGVILEPDSAGRIAWVCGVTLQLDPVHRIGWTHGWIIPMDQFHALTLYWIQSAD